MMTSSNGNIFSVTVLLCGEFTGPSEFPTQRPVTRSFDVFFDLRLNKRLSKQPRGWWFETQSWSLWRHCNVANQNWVYTKHFIWYIKKGSSYSRPCFRREICLSLQWRHNECDDVSNHRRLQCLLEPFVQAQIQENIKASRHWPLENLPVTGGFPFQRASNAENVSIWWRHHGRR